MNKENWLALMFGIMLWDETKKIGCAVSRNKKKKEGFVVVMYSPAVFDNSPENYARHIKPPNGYKAGST